MAIVWNGVNAVQGGQCVYVMLHALTPHIANIKNVMGAGSVLDSGGMIGFVVFWVATCCFLVIPIPKVETILCPMLLPASNALTDERFGLCETHCFYHLRDCNVCMDPYQSWRYRGGSATARNRTRLGEDMVDNQICPSWSSFLCNFRLKRCGFPEICHET